MQYMSLTAQGVVMAAGDGEEKTPIVPHMPELIFGLVFFLLLLLFVWKVIWPKLEGVHAERTEAIQGGMEKAEKAQAEAEAAKREYEALLAEARSDAAQIREDARVQGAAIVDELRGQGQSEATRITEAAHKQIEAERQQAYVSLRGDVGRLSTDLASRIVGESLEEETRRKGIVDRFLAELDNGSITPEQAGQGN